MGEMVSALKEQSKAILAMLTVAIFSVIGMVVLDFFNVTIKAMPGLGNGTGSINVTTQAVVTLFITSFGLVGSFASMTVLILVIKVVIGVVRGLKA